jgi:hypothetical protein
MLDAGADRGRRRGRRDDVPDHRRGRVVLFCAVHEVRIGLGLDDATAETLCRELAAAAVAVT